MHTIHHVFAFSWSRQQTTALSFALDKVTRGKTWPETWMDEHVERNAGSPKSITLFSTHTHNNQAYTSENCRIKGAAMEPSKRYVAGRVIAYTAQRTAQQLCILFNSPINNGVKLLGNYALCREQWILFDYACNENKLLMTLLPLHMWSSMHYYHGHNMSKRARAPSSCNIMHSMVAMHAHGRRIRSTVVLWLDKHFV